ncbi:hypothetical protein AVEN_242235-1 [Araneus ventricosus]|uniref:DDE-1 domain-containing protein n=1 Tax=Araneus ventricosus TaxID=182803 RepID=A0A4Y2RE10_ARAVE|nr:hypothetical protein AVEN_242235-1 [Araneus ventricosus]
MLQPLDQGIIRSFKVRYRKLHLRHVLSQISSYKSSVELAKSVSVLEAISWTTSALKKVELGCVLKCFKKAGVLNTSEVARVSTTEKREKELADLVANLDSNVSDYPLRKKICMFPISFIGIPLKHWPFLRMMRNRQ